MKTEKCLTGIETIVLSSKLLVKMKLCETACASVLATILTSPPPIPCLRQ